MFYCNTIGSQTEIVFDGSSLVFDKDGNLCKQLPMFKEAFETVVVNDDGTIDSPVIESADHLPNAELDIQDFQPGLNIKMVYEALLLGIRDYFQKMNFSKAILGSSGGVDSAVVLSLACEALGNENVRAILMPSPYSSEHSVKDAEQLSKNLNNPYDIIRIDKIYEDFLETLKPVFNK